VFFWKQEGASIVCVPNEAVNNLACLKLILTEFACGMKKVRIRYTVTKSLLMLLLLNTWTSGYAMLSQKALLMILKTWRLLRCWSS